MQHEVLAQMCCLIRAPRKSFSTARTSGHQGEMWKLTHDESYLMTCMQNVYNIDHKNVCHYAFKRPKYVDNYYLRAFEVSLES